MQSEIGEPRPTGVTSQPLNKKTKGTLTGALGDHVKGVHRVHTHGDRYTLKSTHKSSDA